MMTRKSVQRAMAARLLPSTKIGPHGHGSVGVGSWHQRNAHASSTPPRRLFNASEPSTVSRRTSESMAALLLRLTRVTLHHQMHLSLFPGAASLWLMRQC